MIQIYLKRILTVSRFCGLLPLKGSLNTAKVYSVSKSWILYNIILSFAHLILLYFLFQHTFDSEYTSDISNMGKYISIYSSIAPNLIFILFLTMKCQTFIKCLDYMSMVIIFLTHIEVRLSYKNLLCGMYRQVVVGILLCVIIPSSASLDGSLLLPVALLLQSIILTTSVLLFLSTSAQLKYLFSTLNSTLNTNSISWATVECLSRCHLLLTDATEDFNSVFTGPILHLTLISFAGVLFSSFRVLQMLYRYSGDGILIATRSVHTIYLTGMLAAILQSCYFVCNQANETGKNIHKLLLVITDSKLSQKLKIFSLQVLHRPVEFHAWGMFKFDYGLLLSLATAATTYLVILVQFDQAKNDLPKSYNNLSNLN